VRLANADVKHTSADGASNFCGRCIKWYTAPNERTLWLTTLRCAAHYDHASDRAHWCVNGSKRVGMEMKRVEQFITESMSSSEWEMLSGLVLDDHYCGRNIVALS
jgi:hypothetical protein